MITSNEQNVRLEIFEGRIPLSEAGAELLRIEKAQHESERLRRIEIAETLGGEVARLKKLLRTNGIEWHNG